MYIESLSVKNVRNISEVQLQPGPGINLLTGPNAAGKTALLEAIYLLARARSFRSPRIKEVIRKQQQSLQVMARLRNGRQEDVVTGLEKAYGSTSIRYQGRTLHTVSEQARNLPLVINTPDSHKLVSGSPKERRHWLDWAMFHVEPAYLDTWKTYQKALRHRNALLKNDSSARQFMAWEESMVKTAAELNLRRKSFTGKLQEKLAGRDQGGFRQCMELEFYSGEPGEKSFETYLNEDREKDRRQGYTVFGPQRADIRFLGDGELIAKSYSRGQIKRFVIALQLAQAQVFELLGGESPVFLFDDYAAELDSGTRKTILAQLRDYSGQVFITATEADGDLDKLTNLVMFHVEQGKFNKVVE